MAQAATVLAAQSAAVKSEQDAKIEQGDDALTVLSSDDSDASIFDLRERFHASDGEWSDGEESLISDDNEDVDAEAEKDAVAKWRQKQQLQDDRDFAFVYVSFEEAYLEAGRAVAMAWSRCRQRAELSLNTDAAHALSLTAISAKIKACDEIRASNELKAP